MRGGLENKLQVGYWEYDFDKDGGAVGTIALRGTKLPVGAIVHNGLIITEADLTGASAEVALHITGAADVLVAVVGTTMDVGELIDAVCVGTAATAIQVATVAKGVTATITVQAVTAGKFVVMLQYFVPTDD
jgi:VCBS repeat-containing protein